MSNYSGKFDINSINNPWNKAFDLIKDNSTVLDVGCSSGNFGEALIEHKSCKVDGIEPDEGDAKLAKLKLRTVYSGFVEDAFLYDLKDRKYDYIVFLDVIEHLFDPVNTLKNLRNYLKPGGGIIFSIPNMGHISVRLELLRGDFRYGNTGLLDNTHLHFYTRIEIERVLEEAGYKVDKLDFIEALYPKNLIVKELNKIGIKKTTNKFIDMLMEPDAYVFQYVGLASIGTGNTEKRPHYFPNPQKTVMSW
jgi:2-polyprenyl-3-methyl-5-hydroxy-6-metoxy-1,4-benzoquinol methylase